MNKPVERPEAVTLLTEMLRASYQERVGAPAPMWDADAAVEVCASALREILRLRQLVPDEPTANIEAALHAIPARWQRFLAESEGEG